MNWLIPEAVPHKIALQLYTVRRELEENPERTLEKIRRIGFDAVEVAPLSEALSARDLSRMLQSFELSVVAIHCDLPAGDRTDRAADFAQEFNCRRLIWHGWPQDAAFGTIKELHGLIDQYNEAQANTARMGLELGLHNHWWEFEPVEGQYPYQLFLKKLSPEIFFELDTYWVRAAGLDPAAFLDELGARVTLLHIKDGSAKKGEPMVAVGSGVMDFPGILKAATPKLEWLVIELDECETDIWRATEQSIQYLRQL